MFLRLGVVFLCALLFFRMGRAAEVVNVFTWTNYVPHSVIQQFEHQTGIKVNLSEYDSNEDLFAKLKVAPHAGYDVIFPSSYYVERMRHDGMLRLIDRKALSNHRYIDPLLLNKTFDPQNLYSYPYLWGTTAIVVDKRFWDPKTVQNWHDLWQPRFKNQLLIYNDAREVFAAALFTLHDSINTQDPLKIKQAYQQLLKLVPNVRLYSSDSAINAFADDDVTIGMAMSGDVFLARQSNPNLVYIYPKDGFSVWLDCMAVPKYAPHFSNAMTFMNFLMRPQIAKQVALSQGYSSPNLQARRLMPKRYRQDPLLYPSAEVLKRGQMQHDIGKARPIIMHYWQLLKLQ